MSLGPLSAAVVDLDDTDGLLSADRQGLLRAASMAGAQVRSTAAALDEGDLRPVADDVPPRTIVWVAGRGNAESAGTVLAAALGGAVAAPIVVTAEAPPWLGALDVVVIAGDDAGEPALVSAAAMAVRRGARVIVIAPYEGPLRDATAGRSVALPPRIHVPDDFTLSRFYAAGLAALQAISVIPSAELDDLADQLDAETLRNSVGRDLFTNPAKELAQRMAGRDVVVAGDTAATVALARHASRMMLRAGHTTVAAAGLPDVLVAYGTGWGRDTGAAPSIFHDDDLDGPLPARSRTIVLTSNADRQTVAARLRGFDDVDVVNANDVPDAESGVDRDFPGSAATPRITRPEHQWALLAVRIEMAAVYQRLIRG